MKFPFFNSFTAIRAAAAAVVLASSLGIAHAAGAASAPPVIVTHYMPWFATKAFSGAWGWHWTMNHYDPDLTTNGRPQIASHYTPLIGPYDSDDPDTLQCQVMLMKLAGIDGVIVDWYGNDPFADYAVNNRNTLALIPYLRRAGLRYAICYETHTLVTETQGGFLKQSDVVTHGEKLMQWMQQHFFSDPSYLKIGGASVPLTFGDPYYTDVQWNRIFSVLPVKPLYFTEITRQEPTAAVGAFDWPLPAGGTQVGLAKQEQFIKSIPTLPMAIACAFPRFDDIYAQAGVGKSWGRIADDGGKTFTTTLDRALTSGAPVVQLVTWNDWGEGTQIEPSVEYGYRDLEAVQQARRKFVQPAFRPNPAALRIPVEWYRLRKAEASDPAAEHALAPVFDMVVHGKIAAARRILKHYESGAAAGSVR